MMADKRQKIQKGSVLQVWKPYRVISLPNQDDDDARYQDLPRFQPCDVLNHATTNQIMMTSHHHSSDKDFGIFVAKLSQHTSYNALCVQSVLELVISTNKKTEEWSAAIEKLQKKSISTTNNGGGSSSISNNNNNDDRDHDDDDDDGAILLVEGWPFVQDLIPWNSFQGFYQHLKSRCLHQITLPHPLSNYATKTLLNISQPDFDRAIQIAHTNNWIPKLTQNRLQASQFFLDYIASLPPRIVGVLIEDPILECKHEEEEETDRLQQSCCPNLTLELSVDENKKIILCSSIAIYDIDACEDTFVSTRPASQSCPCLKCKAHPNLPMENPLDSVASSRRLAHWYFQQGEYDNASKLYRKCHDAIIGDDERAAADFWHSMAAVELSRSRFVKAQELWKEGCRYAKLHSGIALQIEKQRSYRYFEPLVTQTPVVDAVPKYKIIGSPSSFSSCLFVTENMVSEATCRQLINWAHDYAFTGGWTSGRHYAVPTIDIPVHMYPKLLKWFNHWMEQDMMALLQAQFQTKQRFFVHDAFLVQYDACESSHFLPLHFDESTHSFVLALNDDFDGGGTYMYDLDETITPKTGTVVTFRGDQLLHGGNCVTKGVRFILAVFLFADSENAASSSIENGEEPYSKSFSSMIRTTKRQKTSEEKFSFSFF